MKAHGLARLGKDVEVRRTAAGEAVANLSLAFTFGPKDQGGKRATQWVKASLWGKLVDPLSPYLLKGKQVVVDLRDVHIETFEGNNGTVHNLVGTITEIELAGDKPQSQGQPAAQAPRQAPVSNGFEDMDDDIPF